MRISDWSSDVCSSGLVGIRPHVRAGGEQPTPLLPDRLGKARRILAEPRFDAAHHVRMKRCLVAGPPKGDRLMRDALQPYSEAIAPWRPWRGLERIAPSQPCLGPLPGIVEVATVAPDPIPPPRG